jgi:hypothetical protein
MTETSDTQVRCQPAKRALREVADRENPLQAMIDLEIALANAAWAMENRDRLLASNITLASQKSAEALAGEACARTFRALTRATWWQGPNCFCGRK